MDDPKSNLIMNTNLLPIYLYTFLRKEQWLYQKVLDVELKWFGNHFQNFKQLILLTLSAPMFLFYNPIKCQKTRDFMTFSGGIERNHWPEMGLSEISGAHLELP